MNSNTSSITSREGRNPNDRDIHGGNHTFDTDIVLSDDSELDTLVSKTLQKISVSKFNSKAKACSALHSRLISSGQLTESNIRTVNGGIEQRICSKGLPYPRFALKPHTLIPWEGPSPSISWLLVIHKLIRPMAFSCRECNWRCSISKRTLQIIKRCCCASETSQRSKTRDRWEGLVWFSGPSASTHPSIDMSWIIQL